MLKWTDSLYLTH